MHMHIMHSLSYILFCLCLKWTKCVPFQCSLTYEKQHRVHFICTCVCFRTERFQESQWRKMKTPEGETGATRLSLSSPVLVTQWGWETSGGFLTFATEMEEVTSSFLFLCPMSIWTFSQCLSCTVELAFYNFMPN